MYIAPSILAADFSRLADEIKRIEDARFIHIDVMDGHFVPNLSVGPAVVKSLRPLTKQLFDVHLMLEHPSAFIDRFADAGADIISVHPTCADKTEELVPYIRKRGLKAGLTLKPADSPELVYPFGAELFSVTVMTVEPGFGGQKLMKEPLAKIREIKSHFPHILVAVDGGVNRQTAPLCLEAGADILVAGTAVFKAENPKAEMSILAGE